MRECVASNVRVPVKGEQLLFGSTSNQRMPVANYLHMLTAPAGCAEILHEPVELSHIETKREHTTGQRCRPAAGEQQCQGRCLRSVAGRKHDLADDAAYRHLNGGHIAGYRLVRRSPEQVGATSRRI
jgi:hypothetical protein